MIFTTVYTPEYVNQVDRCVRTAASHHLTIFAEAMPSLGSWNHNTLLKHDHLLRMFSFFPGEDIWFLDADSELVRNPLPEMAQIMAARPFDIAMRWTGWPEKVGHGVNRPGHGWGRWHAGSMILPASGSRVEIIERAKEIVRTEGIKPAPEEHAICEAMIRMDVEVYDMEARFCQVFDRGAWSRENTYIVQHQASRQLKRVVNEGASR